MRRTILPFALGWLIGMAAVLSAAFGQTLTIGPRVAKPGQAIVGAIDDIPGLPPGAVDELVAVSVEGGEAIKCGLGKIHFWAPPGKHQATWKRTARVPGRTEISFIPGPKFDIKAPRFEDLIPQERVIPEATVQQTATATVEVEGVAPDPKPDPTPDPAPNPAPVTARKLWLVALTDWKQQTPAQTIVLTDMAYWQAVEAAGHRYEHYQVGSADASKFAAFLRYPAEFVVMDADSGRVIAVEQMPTDVRDDWAKALVAKYAGAK
jgi:hypothetical protein